MSKDFEYIKKGVVEVNKGFQNCRLHCHKQTDEFNSTITKHGERIKVLSGKFSFQAKLVIVIVGGTIVTLVKVFLVG